MVHNGNNDLCSKIGEHIHNHFGLFVVVIQSDVIYGGCLQKENDIKGWIRTIYSLYFHHDLCWFG